MPPRTYAEANQVGLDLIALWVEKEGIECDFERRDNFVYSESMEGADQVKEEVVAEQRAGLDASFVTDTSLPFDVTGALRLRDQAQFHPRKYLLHLASLVDGDGCFIFENSPVTGIDEGEPCMIEAQAGRVLATDVIMATHFPFLDRGLSFPRVHQKRSYAIVGPVPSAAPDGMFISADSPTRSIRTIPDGDRTLLLVGGNGHPAGRRKRPKRNTATSRWAEERFGMADLTHRWSSQDGSTVDMLPYAGTARRTSKSVYTATGFGKWGMTNGAVAATVVTDAILGDENRFAQLFDPHRITVSASLGDFVEENLNVAKHFVQDRVAHPQRGPFDELGLGDAAVERVGLGRSRCLSRRGRNPARGGGRVHSSRLRGPVERCREELGLSVSRIALRPRRQGAPRAGDPGPREEGHLKEHASRYVKSSSAEPGGAPLLWRVTPMK